MTVTLVHPDELRGAFCSALSAMYKAEVPLYEDLVQMVDEINDRVWQADGKIFELDRVNVERHGAIRLGKPSELATVARLFKLMGMYPVGYYDLSSCGVPVHSTAFRPITSSSLAKNPFRVFTSLLRPELIAPEIRSQALDILEERQIFSDKLLVLLEEAEKQGGVSDEQTTSFINLLVDVFRWHDTAAVSYGLYEKLKSAHPLLADIAGFKGPHINHLTPRVLDIDLAQSTMSERGLDPKQIIEGPPRRLCPILLRQTSFKALNEGISFVGSPKDGMHGSHRARFGEIELRGCALTPKGHALYLSLMEEARQTASRDDNQDYQRHLEEVFARFPDKWDILRREKLAYFTYSKNTTEAISKANLEAHISSGEVTFTPIVFEDFLPASAAGIFQSNLDEKSVETPTTSAAKESFEESLSCGVHDLCDLYERMQEESLKSLGAVA